MLSTSSSTSPNPSETFATRYSLNIESISFGSLQTIHDLYITDNTTAYCTQKACDKYWTMSNGN